MTFNTGTKFEHISYKIPSTLEKRCYPCQKSYSDCASMYPPAKNTMLWSSFGFCPFPLVPSRVASAVKPINQSMIPPCWIWWKSGDQKPSWTITSALQNLKKYLFSWNFRAGCRKYNSRWYPKPKGWNASSTFAVRLHHTLKGSFYA